MKYDSMSKSSVLLSNVDCLSHPKSYCMHLLAKWEYGQLQAYFAL